jgi:hypothetical protein
MRRVMASSSVGDIDFGRRSFAVNLMASDGVSVGTSASSLVTRHTSWRLRELVLATSKSTLSKRRSASTSASLLDGCRPDNIFRSDAFPEPELPTIAVDTPD